jgi:beta-glucosidase
MLGRSTGCKCVEISVMPGNSRFPDGFLWGAATAAHQIEGHNTHNDWWRSEQRGLLPYRSGAACDSWNRWPDDVRLLSELGLNAYRMSVEWARVEPEPGRFDQTALDTYKRQLEALRAAGIEPMLTLHHFTNPQWLADRGGWANPEVVSRFASYANRAGREFGSLVRWWITINEPSILALKSYLEGAWPPHRPGDLRGGARLLRHAARGHVLARQALRAHRPDALVSMAFAIWPMEAARAWNPIDQLMALLGDWLWQGRVLRRTTRALDWVGVNYYTRIRVGWPPQRASALADPHAGAGDFTDFGWEIYPRGLYDVLRRAGRHGRPVVITENGISDADDDQRPGYIVAHLREVLRAIHDGVDVRGYMHWTLMDNFEWSEGFTQRFGLAELDQATFSRTPRPSARLYGEIARENALSDAVLGRHRSLLADGRFSVT